MDHACKNSHMQVLFEFNIIMIQLFLQTNNYAFTISSVQDACLEHAEGVECTPKVCKNNLPSIFLFSKYCNYYIKPKQC